MTGQVIIELPVQLAFAFGQVILRALLFTFPPPHRIF
jgi:hypothetical protein